MPTYNPALTYIDINETKRYAGLAASEFPIELIKQACTEAQLLAKPKAIWQVYTYDPEKAVIMGQEPLAIQGLAIIKHLSTAIKLVILAVTIGEQLETTVSQHFAKGEYSAGLLLDAAGTTAVEMAADQISHIIGQQAANGGLLSISRFSPGYGDWNITVQPKILKLTQAEEIGLTTTPTCMLLPRKSVTAVIGLIPHNSYQEASTECQHQDCSACTQLKCIYRKGK